jgi:hypothetical protein
MKSSATWFIATLLVLGGLCLLPLFRTAGVTDGGWDPKQVKLVGSVVASFVLGLAALAIIFLKKEEADKRRAYAMIGTIAGYWLPSPVQ